MSKYSMITTAYSILHNEIENENDLAKYEFSLSDYYVACDVMENLRSPGSRTKTFVKNVALFFHKCGYSVVLDKRNGNYVVSC